MRNKLFADVAGRLRVAGFAAAIALCGASSLALANGTPPPESVATDQTNVQGVVAYPEPPAGFNPLSASDAEIEQYGFPPRPDAQSEPDQYRHWQKLVSVPRVANPKLQQTTIHNGPAQAVSAGATLKNKTVSATSTNWSGYAVTGKNGTFKSNNSAIYAEWVVPIAQQPFGVCNGGWNYSSQWIGFDGYNSGDVLQAGTEVDAYCSGGTTDTFYSSWIEWYPYVETRVSSPPAEPGDLMGSEVWYTTTSPYGHAYLANYTLNEAATYTFNPPPGTTYVGNSAEWIEERPGVSGGLADLTNYVADPFNVDYAKTAKGSFYPSKSPGGTKRIAISMVCPPWNASGCSSPTVISTPYLSGLDTIWFYDSGPAYGSGLP
jgi:hypothetical protein